MPKLIVVVVTDLRVCRDVIRVWDEAGVPGATILDSVGMRHLRNGDLQRDDLPLMPSLRNVLESEEYNHRTLFSVVPDDFDIENLVHRTEELVGSFEVDHTGLLFVIPVLDVRGLRHSQ